MIITNNTIHIFVYMAHTFLLRIYLEVELLDLRLCVSSTLEICNK